LFIRIFPCVDGTNKAKEYGDHQGLSSMFAALI
jgi:hypothetical protein